jgi:uncharacterized protein (TIGR01244 family)
MNLSLRDLARPAVLAGSMLAIALSIATPSLAGTPQAPFGDKVSAAILNYNRATPNVATSGRYDAAAIAEIKALGFRTVVELRGADEKGVAENASAAKAVGLKYVRIPVTTRVPSEAQVRQFARVVENPANYPILVNCVSANRVGAMWALYRAQAGVPAEIAVEEGRTAGLKSREAAVRDRLGLPALTQ